MKLIVKFNTGDWLAVGVIAVAVVGVILAHRAAEKRKADGQNEPDPPSEGA